MKVEKYLLSCMTIKNSEICLRRNWNETKQICLCTYSANNIFVIKIWLSKRLQIINVLCKRWKYDMFAGKCKSVLRSNHNRVQIERKTTKWHQKNQELIMNYNHTYLIYVSVLYNWVTRVDIDLRGRHKRVCWVPLSYYI